MSDSCPGCFQSAKGQQQEYEKVKTQALRAATKKHTAQAIYKEGFEWFYCDATDAIARGYPIREFISQHQ